MAKLASNMGKCGKEGIPGKVTFNATLDFNKWCARWREDILMPTSRVMGRFLGRIDLFDWTVRMFSESVWLAPNAANYMKLDDDGKFMNIDENTPVVMRGVKGQPEGQDQKTWAILNALICELALGDTYNVDYMYNGDNVLLARTDKINPTTTITDAKKEIDQVAEIFMGKLGAI